jgi:hypothetical protein
MNWTTMWEFHTRNLNVKWQVTPCDIDPADSFCDEDDIANVRNGTWEWFDSRMVVTFRDGTMLGDDYLGGSAYVNVSDFRDHLGIRAKSREDEHNYGSYFSDMVREACRDARKRLAAMDAIKLRAA